MTKPLTWKIDLEAPCYKRNRATAITILNPCAPCAIIPHGADKRPECFGYCLVFDTGSAKSGIRRQLAEELGLPVVKENGASVGIGDTRVACNLVKFGLWTENNWVVHFSVAAAVPLSGTDVIIGMDVLEKYIFRVDGPNRIVELQEPQKPPASN